MRFPKWLALFLLAALPASAQTPFNALPNPGGMTWTTVTCGTSSTPFGVAGGSYLVVKIPATGSTVWFGWGTNAATTATPSEDFAAGSLIQWGGGTGSCIVASGTQSITVGYK